MVQKRRDASSDASQIKLMLGMVFAHHPNPHSFAAHLVQQTSDGCVRRSRCSCLSSGEIHGTQKKPPRSHCINAVRSRGLFCVTFLASKERRRGPAQVEEAMVLVAVLVARGIAVLLLELEGSTERKKSPRDPTA